MLFVVKALQISRKKLAGMIDHTLIKPTATKDEVVRLCWEAEKYGFGCTVVNPVYVSLARHVLEATAVKVCSTVGFPIGSTLPEVKAFEAKRVVEEGAEEIDMVMNIGALKSKDYETVRKDVEAVVGVKKAHKNVVVKVIIETGLLTDEEKVIACELAKKAGADFVKTSTGLLARGATVEDIRLMRRTVGMDTGVKASGGIRTLKDALAMIEAGANRVGTSTGVAIIEETPK